ncbi:30S ribosomal protein S20 [Candidatus Mycoplasma pogonae]
MANIKSKIKRIKTNEKSRVRNAAIKSRVRTAIKKVKLAVTKSATPEEIKELTSKAHKEINTACSKGVLHKNNASRKTSRLAQFVEKNSTNPTV